MKRAGWYSYDWIDNLGKPGDIIPMIPDGKFGLFVKNFELNKWMLWLLNPINERQTRLITRVRLK